MQNLFSMHNNCKKIILNILNVETNINTFMAYLRCNWPKVSISPNLHMLEDHALNFIRKWKVGFGFYGEQGGESIHHEFKKMRNRYSNIKCPTDRLKYLMTQHLLTSFPEAKKLQPVIKKRKFKKE